MDGSKPWSAAPLCLGYTELSWDQAASPHFLQGQEVLFSVSRKTDLFFLFLFPIYLFYISQAKIPIPAVFINFDLRGVSLAAQGKFFSYSTKTLWLAGD